MSFQSQLTQQADIFTPTVSQDALGGTVNTWNKTIALTPCLLQALSAIKRLMSGSKGVDVTHVLFTNIITVTETDEIEVDGTRFKIIYSKNVRNHHLQIELQELRRG